MNNYYKTWLVSCIFLVIAMVILGGYTRLTDSGLSITEWYLIDGILPPLNDDQWQVLFTKYQAIPQFKIVNFAMDMAGFKQIFWLEYIHRIIGRIIGVAIIIPALFFLLYKADSDKKFIIMMMILIILQGALGWFMVASGLKDNITVSHFRLATHLIVAFVIFALLFHHSLVNFISNNPLSSLNNKNSSFLYKIITVIFVILTIQVFYGALVAGLDAGLIYNEFPMMGENIYPNELLNTELLNILFYNPATVQFIHRIFAYIIILCNIILLFITINNSYAKEINYIILLVTMLILLQVIFGIATIITVVNIHIAVLHQLCALILYAIVFSFYKELRSKKINHELL